MVHEDVVMHAAEGPTNLLLVNKLLVSGCVIYYSLGNLFGVSEIPSAVSEVRCTCFCLKQGLIFALCAVKPLPAVLVTTGCN